MTKRQRTCQKARGRKVKVKLLTILRKIQSLSDEYDSVEEELLTNDAENLLCCLTTAKLSLEEAVENYTTYL